MNDQRRAWRAATALVSIAGLALVACGAATDDPVSDRLEHFHRAVASGDGEGACGDLAAEARRSLESEEGKPCSEAILELGLPEPPGPGEVHRYGSMAQVRHEDDTAFLSRFDSGWRVVAVGCARQPDDKPYDCDIEVG
ncbi:hypothetical protein NODU109028_06480 [Nocardioides dubius]|uniref:Lipoprotein n=1 Tax=Nocardioides dubius TaxID=317019 RepID=A0ABN1TPC3_9ACTN